MTIGTVQYMAPEQLLNSRQVTEKSDLYSIGAILFRAVSGEHIPSPSTAPTRAGPGQAHDQRTHVDDGAWR